MKISQISFMFLIALLAGCGSPSEASLAGAVTVNGQPMKKGTISLTPEGGDGGTAGATIENGQYKLDKLKPGKYRAFIAAEPDGPVILPNSPEAKRTYTPEEIRRMSGALPHDIQGNNELFEVKAGEQVKDFHLGAAPK